MATPTRVWIATLYQLCILTIFVQISTQESYQNGSVAFKAPDIHWIEQRLDNFNPSDERRWRQRYMVNDQFYKKGGPVLFLLGGEWRASTQPLETATPLMLMAKSFNAIVFQLEHRFYGDSRPTDEMTTDNLRFLSSHQALADAARFRSAMMTERELGSETKWVVFGGSYAGSLAAWFRLKYPHLVVGAAASSAPMVAVVDYPAYFREVVNALGPSCRERVRLAFDEVRSLSRRQDQWPLIDSKFKTCAPYKFVNRVDQQHLMRMLALHFENTVQSHRNAKYDGERHYAVEEVCAMMENRSPLEGLSAVNDALLKATDKQCLRVDYAGFIGELRNTSYNTEYALDGGRPWLYQTCTEFGFFQSSGESSHVFGDSHPTEYFYAQCRDTFGQSFNETMVAEGVARINSEFGGRRLRTSNVTFAIGSVDPWRTLSVLKSLSRDVISVHGEGVSHCGDMRPALATDSLALRTMRTEIQAEVERWLR